MLSIEPASESSKGRRGASFSRLPFAKPRADRGGGPAATERDAHQRPDPARGTPGHRRAVLEPHGSALEDLAERVQEGQTLTQALTRHPWIGRMVRQLVEVGEQTGTLDIVLLRAASRWRSGGAMGQAIAALMYPGVVFLAAIGVTGFMLIFAVPRLTSYLTTMGQGCPATQLLVDASDFLLTSWPLLVGLALLAAISFGLAYPLRRAPPDRRTVPAGSRHRLHHGTSVAMFSRSFALLLASGVTIIEALRTYQDLHRNGRLSVLIANARDGVIAGDLLAPGLGPQDLHPTREHGHRRAFRESGPDAPRLRRVPRAAPRLLVQMLSSVVEIAVILLVGGSSDTSVAFMMALYGTLPMKPHHSTPVLLALLPRRRRPSREGDDPTVPSSAPGPDRAPPEVAPVREAVQAVVGGMVDITLSKEDPTRLVEARFDQRHPGELADELGRATGESVVASQQVADRPVSISLRNVDLEGALDAVAMSMGWSRLRRRRLLPLHRR